MATGTERTPLLQHRSGVRSSSSMLNPQSVSSFEMAEKDNYSINVSTSSSSSNVEGGTIHILGAVPDDLPNLSNEGLHRRNGRVVFTEDHHGRILTDGPPASEAHNLNAKLDSLDYDNCENEIYLHEEHSKSLQKLLRQQAARWFVMCLVGCLTGLTASCIDMAITELSRVKFMLIQQYYIDAILSRISLLVPLLVWVAWNVACVGVASFLTSFCEPVAAGSGIPQIKCFLNGIKIPHVVRIKTLIVKVIGVTLSVAGGLSIGKEGPMIHSGAVIAAGVSQGRSTTFGFDLHMFEYFRTDTEKRDFVSGGAAAGVSAAFGAPVGGVLFSLEEGASFWNQSLTWRIFFASMVSTFTLNVILSIYHHVPGQLSYGGLINFERFSDMSWRVQEIPVFIIMGIIGGLFGALYNQINYKLTSFRQRNVKRPILKMIEAMVIALMSGMAAFFLIYFDPSCQNEGKDPNKFPLQMYCKDGQTSSMATLWFQSPEESVRSLFHDTYGTYEPITLTVFCVVYFLLACWTYGSSVPSGIFIPGLVVGAAWGRLGAIICKRIFRQGDWVNPGKFALIGAAAQLGGIVRMTLSLSVILVEATGNISLGLPLMIVLMVAKWTGDMFTEGIYDMHIHMQGVPVLAWEPPAMTSGITAKEVMSHPVITLKSVEKVSTIVDMLTKERHDGFPVVLQDEDNDLHAFDEFFNRTSFGVLEGVITRTQLIVLLRRKYFTGGDSNDRLTPLRLRDFREIYPRFPRIENVHISEEDRDRFIDLRPFMNPAPYAVYENTSMPRIFKLFRGLGLRHLVVINRKNEVVGIVTRKDLARYKFFRHNGRCGILELGMATN